MLSIHVFAFLHSLIPAVDVTTYGQKAGRAIESSMLSRVRLAVKS